MPVYRSDFVVDFFRVGCVVGGLCCAIDMNLQGTS